MINHTQNTLFLSQEELLQLTGKRLSKSQVLALRHMGIEHKTRPDGTVAVLRQHVIEVFAGTSRQAENKKNIEPKWEAINAKKA